MAYESDVDMAVDTKADEEERDDDSDVEPDEGDEVRFLSLSHHTDRANFCPPTGTPRRGIGRTHPAAVPVTTASQDQTKATPDTQSERTIEQGRIYSEWGRTEPTTLSPRYIQGYGGN